MSVQSPWSCSFVRLQNVVQQTFSFAQKMPPPHVFFANGLYLVHGPPPLLTSQNKVLIGSGQSQGPILIGSHWFMAGHPTGGCPMENSRKQTGP